MSHQTLKEEINQAVIKIEKAGHPQDLGEKTSEFEKVIYSEIERVVNHVLSQVDEVLKKKAYVPVLGSNQSWIGESVEVVALSDAQEAIKLIK